jgi:hypothetical protein
MSWKVNMHTCDKDIYQAYIILNRPLYKIIIFTVYIKDMYFNDTYV